jgi:hypothetical protein
MALRKRESKLFVRLRKHLKNIHFTRIESSTIQGIPDVHGCGNGVSFWIELKSTDDSFPKLSKFQQSWCFEYARHGGRVFILHQTLSQRALKLYRVVGSQQPSSTLVLVLVFSFSRSSKNHHRPIARSSVAGSGCSSRFSLSVRYSVLTSTGH